MQSRLDLLRRQAGNARSGQLDRQRIPSRRRQTLAIEGALSLVTLNAGLSAAVARSMKSCVASEAMSDSMDSDSSVAPGTESEREPDNDLPWHTQGFAARRDNPHARCSAEQGLRELGRGVDQVLTGIHDEQ